MFSSGYLKIGAPLLVLLLLNTKLVNCQEEGGEEEEPERTCQQYLYGLMRKVVAVMPKCFGLGANGNRINLKFKRPVERLSRFYCIVKCLLSELEVLDEVGILDEVNALFFFQDNIPSHVLPAVIEVAGPCLEMASTLVPSQYYCQSYGPFTQCLVRAFMLGLGPWAIDCYGTATFAGMFGALSYFVPPVPPAPADRRIITPSENTTRLLQRMSELRKQRRLAMPSVLDPGTLNQSNTISPTSTPEPTTTETTTTTTTTTTTPPPVVTATTTPNLLIQSATKLPYHDYYNVLGSSDSDSATDSINIPEVPENERKLFQNFSDNDMEVLIEFGEQIELLVRQMR